MPKGHKRTKGVPELHDEIKARVTLALTSTAVQGLDSLAEKFEISRSELVEQIGRGEIQVHKKTVLSSIDPAARQFLEKATQNLRKSGRVQTMTPSLNIVSFRERDKLPHAPGVYIVTDLIAEHSGSSGDLKYVFLDEDFVGSLKFNFLSDLDEDCFILWIVCQEYDALPYVRQQLLAFFSNLQNELWLNQLAINLAKQSTSEPKDEVELHPKITLFDAGNIVARAILERNLEENQD